MKNNDLIRSISGGSETLTSIKIEDISFVKLYSEFSIIYMVTKDIINKQLFRNGDISKALESNGFLKINRDILINPIHIKEIIDSKKREIEMKCKTVLQVSRRKWHLVKLILELT